MSAAEALSASFAQKPDLTRSRSTGSIDPACFTILYAYRIGDINISREIEAKIRKHDCLRIRLEAFHKYMDRMMSQIPYVACPDIVLVSASLLSSLPDMLSHMLNVAESDIFVDSDN